MPRYHFNLRLGQQLTTDEIGVELPDLEAARREAIQTAGEIISERALQGRPIELRQAFEVSDGTRKVLMTVPFADAVEIVPDLRQPADPSAEDEDDHPSNNWYAWYASNYSRLAYAARSKLR